jgi:hypothetical protein
LIALPEFASANRGFENNVSNTDVVQNGTFFNSGPVIGYNPIRQLNDAVERKKFGLPEFDLMPALERNCTADCSNTYIPGTQIGSTLAPSSARRPIRSPLPRDRWCANGGGMVAATSNTNSIIPR